jgi:AraC-like DNA-binding protein
MAYREFRPARRLTAFVTCTWERDAPAPGAPTSAAVLPDGCVDLVWRRGELLVAGPDSRPFLSSLPSCDAIVGLRLRPGIAGSALGLPASELRDSRVPLEEIWGPPGAALAEGLGEVASARHRRLLLEDAVAARLPRIGEPDPLVLAAVGTLGAPGSRVGELSELLGTSERQLLRRFNSAVGYGPKTLDRVLRFQRFLARARDGDLARTAADLGYADQAHLTRECVRLSGRTPARVAA